MWACRAPGRPVTPQNPIKEPVRLQSERRHLSSGRVGNVTPELCDVDWHVGENDRSECKTRPSWQTQARFVLTHC